MEAKSLPKEYTRHCERSEAIHAATKEEWIASSQVLLAMTWVGLVLGMTVTVLECD